MNHPLNKEQAEVLFERETVLMGTENRVPIYRALALFGQDAVNYGKKLDERLDVRRLVHHSNGYVLGFIIASLTLRGFQAAASFYNVQLLRKEAS